MLSHAASGCADHWHSRSALTVTAPFPPAAATVGIWVSNATEHLERVEGDVTVLVDEPHPASPSTEMAVSAFTKEMTRRAGNRTVGIS